MWPSIFAKSQNTGEGGITLGAKNLYELIANATAHHTSSSTGRAIGVPVQAYLTWAFERLGTHRDIFGLPIDQLTPAAFKRAGA